MILFLDFDGVTHPLSGTPFDLGCLKHLEAAVAEYAVDIVIASSWREHYPLAQLRKLLGTELATKVVDVTPVIDEPFLKHVRYHEVQKYLAEAGHDEKSWVAVDDTPGFYPPGAPVVWCDPQTGMTARESAQLRSALSILNYQAHGIE
ncbi:MAG: HAD domain-containing protein [Gammaproteobacteria bacterium]|nr:HAD domain-containing protein [Gammaproteobacteria bacterium]MCW8840423.1 HAD domain-containing protein [Gammaproteobacteria bacterium]MCW8957485.1 HAD domain-containing protein [Gammaproteobacteria bacterium]MCW8991809.1 HAD domain-containing protein [Gammaproteobacteria bacterium]